MNNLTEKFIGTDEASKTLGISERRIRALIQEGKLSAFKVGGVWIIPIATLSEITIYGKPGRPKENIREAKKDT